MNVKRTFVGKRRRQVWSQQHSQVMLSTLFFGSEKRKVERCRRKKSAINFQSSQERAHALRNRLNPNMCDMTHLQAVLIMCTSAHFLNLQLLQIVKYIEFHHFIGSQYSQSSKISIDFFLFYRSLYP